MSTPDRNQGPSVRSARLLLALKIALCALITGVFMEVGLRLLARWEPVAPALATPVQEDQFWRYDEVLGWSHLPNTSGTYSNDYFNGFVSMDENGNRRNSREGTYVEGYRNIFFIGDSTTASLEVNDEETVPALLEQGLRARGQKVNVVNLGVRGYGTDQSVRKAVQFAPQYGPTDVVYMYVYNDPFDINLLRRHKRRFGKGVYLKRPQDGSFHEYNYPVPQYPDAYAGLVYLDEKCEPQIYEISVEQPRRDQTLEFVIRKSSYLYRALRFLARRLVGADVAPTIPGLDPLALARSGKVDWTKDFDMAYQDGGAVRERCPAYFDAAFRFFMEKLRREVPTAKRIHVVQFPDKTDDHSTARKMFSALHDDGTVDSYVDLDDVAAAEGVNTDRFRCPGDIHYCREGNRWIADKILELMPIPDSAPAR